jgi:S-DNA-T family DNA segregation ATPase FtsK/SpoIIIE
MLFGRVAASIIVVLIAFVVIMLASNITLHEFLKIIARPFRFLGGKIKTKSRQYREDSDYLRMYNEQNRELDKVVKDAKEEADLEKSLKFASIEAASRGGRTPAEAPSSADLHKDYQKELLEYATGVSSAPEPAESDILGIVQDEIDAFSEVINDFVNEEKEQETENEKNEKTLDFTQKKEEPSVSAEPLREARGLPPVELLHKPEPVQSTLDIETEIAQNSETLVETLKSFGVQTKVVGYCRGPSVTRYELQPAEGVKISKITGLIDDIALNLATTGVRIEAPIPNKRAVGIEVPNRKAEMVYIRSLIESDVYKNHESKLAAVLGKDLSNEIVVCDIAKMPHILIAGTTGSGKSVCVNDMILGILFRAEPDEVRLVMIDPKMVEFTVYNGIPHLYFPVITDAKKAASTLTWAVKKMLERYKVFAEEVVRDLTEYNRRRKEKRELEKMPQIVIFIDELADLMMVASNEVEDSICRLAQMGRAAGIHLVIATQRPSVDVITGIIKANIPSRIALKVASQVDSRTIIDSAGAAEKLLGKGDMLYNPMGASKPIRVQGCWISVAEVERTVKFFKDETTPDYDENAIKEISENAEFIGLSKSEKERMAVENSDIDVSDDKLDEAIEAVIEAGQASTSYLQRKLKLGYGRAARLIDIMEQLGVVGTFEGSKPRQVIMTRQEWLERKINKQD